MIYHIQNKTNYNFAINNLKDLSTICVDTETTGLDPFTSKVLLLQLGNSKNAYVFNMSKLMDVEDGLIGLKTLIESRTIFKILQNAKFDYKMLKSDFGWSMNNFGDTMIAERLLTKGIKNKGFSLADLAEKYNTGHKLDKSIREGFINKVFGQDFTNEEIEYAGKDVLVLEQIYKSQLEIAERDEMLDVLRLENLTIKAVAEMEYNGIYVDQEKWLELLDSAEKAKNDALIKLLAYFNDTNGQLDIFGNLDINFNSSVQLKKLLSDKLGFELESTNEKYLTQFKDTYPVIEDLFSYREQAKKISTYGAEFLQHVNPVTNRIHANYLQLGTDSGRMSCNEPNIQNIPAPREENAPDYRRPFCVQDPDYKFISCDFASQEIRVLTQLSGEQAFIDAIKEGRDLHKMSASLVFNIPEDQVTKQQRTFSKTITFSLVYGTSAFGLAKTLGIETNEAEELIKKYFNAFPKIKKLLEIFEQQGTRTRYAYSPLDGRRRYLYNVDWDDKKKRKHALNICKNHPIQGELLDKRPSSVYI